MSAYNLFHTALFRMIDFRNGTGIYRKLAQLKKEQYLPPEELQNLQTRRLREILPHARDHSPYYRDLWSRRGITVDEHFHRSSLLQLPLLRRPDLQENWKHILCDDAVGHSPDASGGSTGEPVHFYHDRDYAAFSTASRLLFQDWMGIRSGDKTAVFWGADRDLKDASRYDRLMLRLNRVKQLNSFAMTGQAVAGFIDVINRFKPKYIYGYASSLHHVAEHINRTVPLAFRPVAVRSSAEMLLDFQRDAIEGAFRTRVYDFYGSRETNNIAAECPTHRGLHVFASGRIVEVVDDDGHPLPAGEMGQVAVTDLTNRYFPFIRYVNGDMASVKEGLCSCGRTYPLLERIHGRISDMIVVNGQYIHGEFFTHLFYGRPEIRQFQLVQETPTDLRLYIVPRTDEVDVAFLRRAVIEKVGPGVTLEIIRTQHIQPTAGGKHRFTISRLHDNT
ncbi:MAG: hypothetical protein OEW00_07135 [candidate division Zixibacteria bacterium]|nr:hypothetical protein [candidate division Zixibacteria bacterium]